MAGLIMLEFPGELAPEGEELREEHVVLDIPFNKSVVRGSDILTRTEDGHLSTPNLFFDPERWSNAYKEQKQCGYIFTPRSWVPLVSLASRLVFFERFKVVMNDDADRLAKTSRYRFSDWVRRLAAKGACSVECREALASPRPRFVPIREDEVRRVLPESWLGSSPDLARELAAGFDSCLPDGVLAEAHDALLQTVGDLATCISSLEEGGGFAKASKLDEKRELQVRIRDCLRNRGVPVREGTEIAGGETDLVARDLIVIENKVAHQPVKDPFGSGPHYAWQARRYTIPICQTVCIVILAYRPTDEASVLPLARRIRVMPPGSGPQDVAQVRIVVPFGHGVPHDAKAPPPG